MAPARRGGDNSADLRFLGEALLALRDAQRASHAAAARGSDPRVRALARRASAAYADDIGMITSMLLGLGRQADGPAGSCAARSVTRPVTATTDPRTVDALEIDRRFIDILTAYAEAALVSARTELIEGFDGASRRLAACTSRADWRKLAELSFPAPARDQHPAPGRPATIVQR